MLQKIADLHRACFSDRPWSMDDFADLKKSGCEIIASDNGFIVWRVVLDEGEIITIGVHPDARKSGIAATMLILVETDMKKNGVIKVFLDVAENNIPARALYDSAGYKTIGARLKYYDNITAILMEKIL